MGVSCRLRAFRDARRRASWLVLCVIVSMPIRQLQDDVNEIEEAELRRLEGAATVGNGAHDEAPMEMNIAPAEVVEQMSAGMCQRHSAMRTVQGEEMQAISCVMHMATGIREIPLPRLEAAIEVEAAVRTSKKRRRKEILGSKWYCQFCKHYTEREVDGAAVLACGRCFVCSGLNAVFLLSAFVAW